MTQLRIATVWLDGCSGCHMSFLDLDDRLLALAERVQFAYSPLVDAKEFPPDVDITLVEGAVATQDDEERIRAIRRNTHFLIALGDCAVTGNVPSMRNQFAVDCVLQRAYLENADTNPAVPHCNLPALLPRCRAVHEVVPVDLFLAGCPPGRELIHFALSELLDGRIPDVSLRSRFGA